MWKILLVAAVVSVGCRGNSSEKQPAPFPLTEFHFDYPSEKDIQKSRNSVAVPRRPARVILVESIWESLGSVHLTLARDLLVKDGYSTPFSDVIPFMTADLEVPSKDVRAIRQGAANKKGDVILYLVHNPTVGGHGSVLQILNITIIGSFIIPSQKVVVTNALYGAVIDVRTGAHFEVARPNPITLQAEGWTTSANAARKKHELLKEVLEKTSAEFFKRVRRDYHALSLKAREASKEADDSPKE